MTPAELRATRARLGLSLAALAALLDVPINTLSRWELGRMSIRHPRILALALERLEQTRRARGDKE